MSRSVYTGSLTDLSLPSVFLISTRAGSLLDTYVLVYAPREQLDANEWLEVPVDAATSKGVVATKGNNNK
jgi:hypothetical protein